MKSLPTYIVISLLFPGLLFSQAIVFQKSYDFSFDDKFNDIVATPDGGFILVGFMMVSPYVSNMLIVKTDENGEMLWSKTVGGEINCAANKIEQTQSGDFLLAGILEEQAYVLKINSEGDSLWGKIFSNQYGSACIDIVELENSDLLLIQKIFLLPASSNIIYSDTIGNIYWTISAVSNESKTIHLVSDTEFYIAGFNGIVNYTRYIFTKYNILGNIEMNKEFTSFNGVNMCSAISNNIVYMAGSREYNSAYFANIMKSDLEGQLLWENAYFEDGYSFVSSIVPIDIDYIVSCGVHDDEIFIMRVNSEGDSINSVIFNEYDKQRAHAMIHIDDFLFVAGYNFNWGEGGDAYFLKLHLDTLSTGINEPKQDIISQMTIFPNPADEYIDVKTPKELHGQTFELMIHNNLGDKVYQKEYSGDIIMNVSHFEQGLYYLSIVSQNKTLYSNKLIKN